MKQQVLIIEPSSEYYLQLQRTMIAASAEIQLHQAADAVDALALMQECSPEICLINDTAGLENDSALLQELQQNYPATVVILLTEANSAPAYTFSNEKNIHFRFNKRNDFGNIC